MRTHLELASVDAAGAGLCSGLVHRRVPVYDSSVNNNRAHLPPVADMPRLALLFAPALAAAWSSPPPPLSEFIATQHFQPCYNVSRLPALLDGAVQAARLGSTSFKFGLKYPMVGPPPRPVGPPAPASSTRQQARVAGDPFPASPATLADLVQAPQVQGRYAQAAMPAAHPQKLLLNEYTAFSSFTIWAYRVAAACHSTATLPARFTRKRSCGCGRTLHCPAGLPPRGPFCTGGADSVFCQLPPGPDLDKQLQQERAQLTGLTQALLALPSANPLSFWLVLPPATPTHPCHAPALHPRQSPGPAC
eukprot:gene3970-4330_t